MVTRREGFNNQVVPHVIAGALFGVSRGAAGSGERFKGIVLLSQPGQKNSDLTSMSTAELPKVTILQRNPELSHATFALHEETHTIGNALRWMLMKNPLVEFCGYSAPHPSEPVIHVRIQMYDEHSALTALVDALENLDMLAVSVNDKYKSNLALGKFERFDEE
ncbi:DNA-directed RNA polymerase [Auriculariales sp. MPI-PUGE-AT-0066]|nr:DNA-directed RNA polymerase [Auriculariales sp. MPI-PUGE-AT-0066]